MSSYSLTEDKINEFKEAFEIFNKDKDGYITKKRIRRYYEKFGPNSERSRITRHD